MSWTHIIDRQRPLPCQSSLWAVVWVCEGLIMHHKLVYLCFCVCVLVINSDYWPRRQIVLIGQKAEGPRGDHADDLITWFVLCPKSMGKTCSTSPSSHLFFHNLVGTKAQPSGWVKNPNRGVNSQTETNQTKPSGRSSLELHVPHSNPNSLSLTDRASVALPLSVTLSIWWCDSRESTR